MDPTWGCIQTRHRDTTLSHIRLVDPYSELAQLDFAETTHLLGSSLKSLGQVYCDGLRSKFKSIDWHSEIRENPTMVQQPSQKNIPDENTL